MRLVLGWSLCQCATHTCAQVSTLIQFLPGFDTIMVFACSPTPQTLDIRNNTFGHSHLVHLYFELVLKRSACTHVAPKAKAGSAHSIAASTAPAKASEVCALKVVMVCRCKKRKV